MMLAIIADIYTPLLAVFCLYYLRSRFNYKLVLLFFFAYMYVSIFSFIEYHFGWWASIEANFSSHTASVMVIVFALMSANYTVGFYALISAFAYGLLMNSLNYHTWFDILTTMLVCLPCFLLFKKFNYKAL